MNTNSGNNLGQLHKLRSWNGESGDLIMKVRIAHQDHEFRNSGNSTITKIGELPRSP